MLFPLFWTSVHGIFYHNPCYWPQNIQAGWQSGLRLWFKAPVTSVAWIWVPVLSFSLHSYIKVFFHVFWTPAHDICYIYTCYWQQKIQARWPSSLKCWFKAPVTLGCGLESHSCDFVDIPIQSIVSYILNTCTWYLLPSSMLLITQHTGRMTEWCKVLIKGTRHFAGVGSRPNPVIFMRFLYKVLFPVFWTPSHGIFNHYSWYWPHNMQAGWPIGMRRWFKAPGTSVVWVQGLLLSIFWHSYTKYCFLYFEHLHMVSITIINAIDYFPYRQDGRVV